MRQVRKRIRARVTERQHEESADLRFKRPDLGSIEGLVRSIDLAMTRNRRVTGT